MSFYLTEYFASNKVGRVCKWCGPKIEAENFKEAKEKAIKLKVTVLGKWSGDVEWEGADAFCDAASKSADEAWLKDQ